MQMIIQTQFENRLPDLISAYPRLFKGGVTDPYSYLEPGWFAVVDQLCQSIDLMLSDDEAAQFSVAQLKEKAGYLRFRFRCSDAMHFNIAALVNAAEVKTMDICPVSGKTIPTIFLKT